jgi:hypothetical protein
MIEYLFRRGIPTAAKAWLEAANWKVIDGFTAYMLSKFALIDSHDAPERRCELNLAFMDD